MDARVSREREQVLSLSKNSSCLFLSRSSSKKLLLISAGGKRWRGVGGLFTFIEMFTLFTLLIVTNTVWQLFGLDRRPYMYRRLLTSVLVYVHCLRGKADARRRRNATTHLSLSRYGRHGARAHPSRRSGRTSKFPCPGLAVSPCAVPCSHVACRHTLTPTSPSNSPTAIQGVLPMCR